MLESASIESQIIDTLISIHSRIAKKDDLTCSANSGLGMLALLADAVYQFGGDKLWLDRVREHLAAGVAKLSNESLSTSFYNSAPGFGWVIGKLYRTSGFDDGAEVVDGIASSYCEVLESKPNIGYDLINGLAGLSVFARVASRETGDRLQNQVWESLERTATSTPGFSWINQYSKDVGANLGLAHGIPGVIASQAAALIGGWNNKDAEAAVIRGGRWLKLQQMEVSGHKGFPYSSGGTELARLGWCYGIPSVAVCYAWLAQLERSHQKDVLECILEAEAMRNGVSHGITDACICHGEAGWAYVGARISEWLLAGGIGSVDLPSAAQDQQRLESRIEDRVTGSIPHLMNGKVTSLDTLLEGAAGAWLSLAGIHNNRCRTWEGILLLDFPSPTSGSQAL